MKEMEGQRLDRVLSRSGDPGLRGWRRLCETGRVLVNGRTASPALKLRSGHCIRLLPPATAPQASFPHLVCQTPEFAALFKPSGWHSAAVTGSIHSHVEGELETLLPDLTVRPVLLNRLDADTSGLLIVACAPGSGEQWRKAENAGTLFKDYLAVVHGLPDTSLTLRNRLNADNRRQTAIENSDDPSPLRHTLVQPLRPLPAISAFPTHSGPLGLVACSIHKGTRHQIRAHLAHAGYPLAGDGLYGSPLPGPFLLHHGCIRFPGFEANAPAPWDFLEE